MGAVRVSSTVEKPRFRHTGKLFTLFAAVSGGVFWATTSTNSFSVPVNTTIFAVKTERPTEVLQASIVPPAFFFDDSNNALTEHFGIKDANKLLIADNRALQEESAFDDTVKPITTTPVSIPARSAKADEANLPAAIDHPSITALKNQANAPEGALENTISVKSGNTLSGILNSHGVPIDQIPKLLTDEIVKQYLAKLKIGQKLEIVQHPDGNFHSLRARVREDRRITIKRSDDGFAVASIDLPVEKERVVTSGTIEQSLFLAAEQANLKQSTIMELADIFQWELDFAKDIRKGDQFSLVYDRLYRDGSYIGDGDILAAEFIRGGKAHRAIRFTTDDGDTNYYSPDGQSMRRTFMRHPVDVVRITSKFNPNRLHPLLQKIRPHRGVDYGSPYGSPIYATADGTVKKSGTNGAYGKTVILQHGGKFSTLYAHMSKISDKSKVGSRVKQGDVIGYVGKSGRVTGTHLHYEFRVNNEQIDPLKIELPAANPIERKYLPELKAISDEMTAQMQSVLQESTEQVASIISIAAPVSVTNSQ